VTSGLLSTLTLSTLVCSLWRPDSVKVSLARGSVAVLPCWVFPADPQPLADAGFGPLTLLNRSSRTSPQLRHPSLARTPQQCRLNPTHCSQRLHCPKAHPTDARVRHSSATLSGFLGHLKVECWRLQRAVASVEPDVVIRQALALDAEVLSQIDAQLVQCLVHP